MKNKIYSLIKLTISIGLLLLLFTLFDFRESWEALRGMDYRYFGLAFLLFQSGLVIRSFRWHFLLDAVQVSVPIHRLLYLYYVGEFFNTFLPSGLGGDAVKMYELARHSQKRSEAVGTVFLDRVAGLVVLSAMGLAVLPLAPKSLPQQQIVVLGLASLMGLAGPWLLLQRRLAERIIGVMPNILRHKAQSLYDAVHTSGTHALWKALLVSIPFTIILFALNFSLALGLGIEIPFFYFVIFMPLLSLTLLLPSVGALGTRETAYVLLFGSAGISEPMAIALSLSLYFITACSGIIGALLYALDSIVRLRSENETT
ncbi:MAG: lysylphosphatidylglycerol synthase transmembrane domain-containing protein [Chloroflexota bacterium]